MRSELTILEQIDLYLSGDLSPTDATAFEQQIANDPELQHMVNQQKDFIKAVNRKVLRAEINGVAGFAGGGISNFFLGAAGLGVVGIVVFSIIYFSNTEEKIKDEEEKIVEVEQVELIPNTIQLANNLCDSAIGANFYKELPRPETIFSSINTYVEEGPSEEEGVYINYRPGPLRNQRSNNGRLVEVEEEIVVNNVSSTNETEYLDLARRASYPGGYNALKSFIDANLRYPKTAKRKGIEAVIRVDFHVDRDGNIADIEADCIKMNEEDGAPFNDVRRLMNKKIENLFIGNATHVLRTMPKWLAAQNAEGNTYLSWQRMYFKYDLKKGCSSYQLDDEIYREEK